MAKPEEEVAALRCQRLTLLLDALATRGISQRQVAGQLGVPPAYLTDLKGGRRTLTEAVARRLDQEFDVAFDWLLGANVPMESLRIRGFSDPVTAETVQLPVLHQIIAGNPTESPAWDGSTIGVAGAALAAARRAQFPYVLRLPENDATGRLQQHDLILLSCGESPTASIAVVQCKDGLLLARRAGQTWRSLASDRALPTTCKQVGFCVGVVWAPL